MKLILLGSNGQLGKELKNDLRSVSDPICFDKNSLNINNYQLLEETIEKYNPSIIINSAAYTKVDDAEKNKKEAYLVNSEALDFISKIVSRRNIWLIHYSTDYVFDGTKHNRYNENDIPNPINIYGKSKLDGEKKIISSGCNHVIFRTTWVYGEFGKNFIKTIKNLAKVKDSINIVSDQIGVPTSTKLISKVTINLIKDIIKQNYWESGIYNLVPNGETNWFEMTKFISKIAINNFDNENFKNLLIGETLSKNFITAAKRPLNSLLNNTKLQKKLNFTLPNWQEDFLPLVIKILEES